MTQSNKASPASLPGIYYDGKSSSRQSCWMHLTPDGYANFDGLSLAPIKFDEIIVPDRLGNTSRVLVLPNGGFFETSANDALDAMARSMSSASGSWSLHRIERTPLLIVALLLLAISVGYLLVDKGIPYASEQIAHSMSVSWSESLAEGAIVQLDKYYFAPTKLASEEQNKYRDLFNRYLPKESEFSFELLFREGGVIGANAFALPDGQIIVTDELIALAKNENEVLSVLLHEMGHVEHRHSLRSVLESTGVAALFVLFVGDAEHVMEWAVALPSVLVQAAFSRDHEWEADGYALERMQAHGLDSKHFANMMRRLTGQFEVPKVSEKTEPKSDADNKSEGATAKARDVENTAAEESKEDGESLFRYLSTHPVSKERIERFEAAVK